MNSTAMKEQDPFPDGNHSIDGTKECETCLNEAETKVSRVHPCKVERWCHDKDGAINDGQHLKSRLKSPPLLHPVLQLPSTRVKGDRCRNLRVPAHAYTTKTL